MGMFDAPQPQIIMPPAAPEAPPAAPPLQQAQGKKPKRRGMTPTFLGQAAAPGGATGNMVAGVNTLLGQ